MEWAPGTVRHDSDSGRRGGALWLVIYEMLITAASHAVPLLIESASTDFGRSGSAWDAAEMLAQNLGLGKFIWDQFPNGSSDSLGHIMVAVITIGLVGFLLDQLMLHTQRPVS